MQRTYEPNPDALLRIVKEAKGFAYDVETDGLDWKRNHVVGYSVSDGGSSYYVPVRHSGGGNIGNADDFERELHNALGSGSGFIVGHHLKFDVQFSLNHGVDLRNRKLYCTMVTQALINEHTPRFSLGALAKSYGVTPKIEQDLYNHIATSFPGVKATRTSMGHYHRLPGNDWLAATYAAGDTQSTWELFIEQLKEIDKQELQVVFGLENELTRVLVDMERRGVLVDASRIEEAIDHCSEFIVNARMDKLLCDYELNMRSAKEMANYFKMYEITDWPVTDKGNPSFTTSYLEKTDLGQKLISIKNHETFLNTFMKPFVKDHLFKGADGYAVYTSFNQVKTDDYGTVSGRLSSSNPNMQQVPKRNKEIGKQFRRLFVARPGRILCEKDYSQAEPRLYAHYSGEPRLVEGYNATPFIDMHKIASGMLGVTRDRAKVLNLAILYMMGKAKLARSLGISAEEAERLFFAWYKLFPTVTKWRKRAIAVAEQRGFVRTILGRRRRFPDVRGVYKAPNAVIQGGSADILKFKLIELDAYCRSLPADTLTMLLNIHDSVLFEADDSDAGRTALAEAARIMENVNGEPFNLLVPFVVEGKIGKDWSEATYG